MALPNGAGSAECHSQDLTLHTVLSDEVATVRQTLREAFCNRPF
jgi:hypothetical protein